MEFFEFFFSGPGWGWRVVALIVLIDIICTGAAAIIKAVFEGKTQKILAEIKELTKNDNLNEENKESGATIDDFR